MIQRHGHETEVSKSFAQKSTMGADVKYIESAKNVTFFTEESPDK